MFKSKTQPLCRWCGKAIAKRTDYHYVSGQIGSGVNFNKPVVREDIRTNQQITSIKYCYETDRNYERTGRRTIYAYNTWDGESYVDEFFCNGDHAKTFGYAAAVKGLAMPAYNKAVTGETSEDHQPLKFARANQYS